MRTSLPPLAERLQQAARDALLILDPGACNPRGVARSLVEVIDVGMEAANGTGIRSHEALAPARLVLAQLTFLVGFGIGDYPKYEEDESICKRLAGAGEGRSR